MKRIKKIGVLQTAKVFAVIYFVIAAIIIIPFIGISTLIGGHFIPRPFGSVLFGMLLPIGYGILSFIMTVLVCLIYNLISEYIGGIEIELESQEVDY